MADNNVGISAVIMKDGDTWIAQCLEFDIGAQASDLETLQERLEATIAAEYATSMELFGKAFGNIDRAPEVYHQMYSRCRTKMRPPLVPDDPPVQWNDMAICA